MTFTWVHIALLAVVILMAAVSYCLYKWSCRLTPYESDASTMENLKGHKPILAWEEDPIASSIGWDEASEGGANFRTHKLRYVSGHRLEFQPVHPRSWHIAMLLMAVGGATLIYFDGGSYRSSFFNSIGFYGPQCIWLAHFSSYLEAGGFR